MTEAIKPYPDLLSAEEQRALLTQAEELWFDLQKNNLGGFSGINRPFYILHEFKRVIERFGCRDVGLSWSKDDLDAAALRQQPAEPVEAGDDDGPCTDCWDTGVTVQTERRCACQPPLAAAPSVPQDERD